MQIQRSTAFAISSAQISAPLPLPPRRRQIDFEVLYGELQKKGFKPVRNRYGAEKTLSEKALDFFSGLLAGFRDRAPKKVDLDAAPKKIYVDWGSAVVSNGPVLLGTDGIASCAALNIIDPTHENIHYMLHAYSDTSPDTIKTSLEKAKALGIELKDSEIEIMPGSSLTESTTPYILQGLYLVDPNLLDKVVLIRDKVRVLKHNTQAIIVHEGKIFGLHSSAKIPHDQSLGKSKDTNRLDKDEVEVVLRNYLY